MYLLKQRFKKSFELRKMANAYSKDLGQFSIIQISHGIGNETYGVKTITGKILHLFFPKK